MSSRLVSRRAYRFAFTGTSRLFELCKVGIWGRRVFLTFFKTLFPIEFPKGKPENVQHPLHFQPPVKLFHLLALRLMTLDDKVDDVGGSGFPDVFQNVVPD